MTNTLKIVKDAVVEAVPDVRGYIEKTEVVTSRICLRCGCPTRNGWYTTCRRGNCHIDRENCKRGKLKRTVKHKEIIGRDITLEDCLKAIGREKDFYTSAYFVYHNGKPIWQLCKPLHEQSPETINFLAEILKK